jgi:hypothetical protein
MATLTCPVPKVKTETVTRELLELSDGSTGLMLTTVCGRKATVAFYRVARIEGCDDLAWQLTKFIGETGSDPESDSYAVNLTLQTCECRGHYRHGRCKHFSAVASLHAEGRI